MNYNSAKTRFQNSKLIANWYEVLELAPDLYCVDEQDHVAFFVLKNGSRALLIDSGLGMSEFKARALFEHLRVEEFDVLSTHAHCDHVGLNHLAKNVFIGKQEWDKFQQQNEKKQTGYYYALLKNDLPWPDDMTSTEQKSWEPSDFVSPNELIRFGSWCLQPVLLPGHTNGHFVFLEREKNLLFLGDFIISGTNYLHLKDSSLASYIRSLEILLKLIHDAPKPLVLLPCHNDIPLALAHVEKVLQVILKIQGGKIQPIKFWKQDSLFQDSWLYDAEGVKLVIKTDEFSLDPRSC